MYSRGGDGVIWSVVMEWYFRTWEAVVVMGMVGRTGPRVSWGRGRRITSWGI